MIKVFLQGQGQPEEVSDIKQLEALKAEGQVRWVDICTEDDKLAEKVMRLFQCHDFAIQDALRLRHPPKSELFDEHLFLLYRGFSSSQGDLDLESIQLSLFINPSLLVTYHRDTSVGVDQVMQDKHLAGWLENPVMLMTRILNFSARRYLDEVLKVDEVLSDIEDKMQEAGDDILLQQTVNYKTRLRRLNRTFDYHEKLFGELLKNPPEFLALDKEDNIYALRDVYDKFERLESLTSMFYDLCGDLIDGYLSITSHKLNHTMQVLTVITAIFVPLGFLAGLYGMNFTNIPELNHPQGYFILLGVMVTTAISLLVIFKRNKWI